MPPPARDIRVGYAGDRRALAVRTVVRLLNRVLDDEGAAEAALSVTFFSTARMRGMNRRTFGRNRSTDVIAFPLAHPRMVVGDVYVCPAAARRSARQHGVTPREELVRLVVHGVLHVLGYEHPTGGRRVQSPMWSRQERYVRAFMEGGA